MNTNKMTREEIDRAFLDAIGYPEKTRLSKQIILSSTNLGDRILEVERFQPSADGKKTGKDYPTNVLPGTTGATGSGYGTRQNEYPIN